MTSPPIYWVLSLAAFFANKLKTHRNEMDPEVVNLLEAGLAMDAVSFKRIGIVRTEQWGKLARLFESFDALLCPTMARPTEPAEGNDSDYDGVDEAGRCHALDMTSIFNYVAQCPALSVPAWFISAGLPIGLQIVTPRFADVEALATGAALETLRPWADKRRSV